MKRRAALKHLGLGVSSLVLPGWMSGCSSENAPQPIIPYNGVVAIVGAGAAGLYAADILKSKGIKVIILEASDRAGGRVRTLKMSDRPTESLLFTSTAPLSNDFPAELGAELTLGTDSIWNKFVSQLNITTVDLDATSADRYLIDNVYVDHATALNDADFVAAKNFYDNLPNYNGADVTVLQAIQAAGINPRVHDILNGWIGNNFGTNNNQLGILPLAKTLRLLNRDKKRLLLSDNPMQDALLSRFSTVVNEVQTNRRVKQIDYSGDKALITGEIPLAGGGTEPFVVEADKVIVTVPVSILKSGDIQFTPALPASKSTALSNIDMDASLRVLLDFKTNFWGTDSGQLFGGANVPEYLNAGIGRSEGMKTLSLTVNGPKAAALSDLGKDMIPQLLSELDGVFQGKATLNVRRDLNDNIISVIQDWTKEKYIRGGVSYLRPGASTDARSALSASVAGKVFFAGEATDVTGDAGTVNGALLSAERTADEIVALMHE